MASFSAENIKNHGEEEEVDPCLTAMLTMTTSQVLPYVLYASVNLDLFGIIDRESHSGFISPAEVASHLPSHSPESPEILDRVLRLLASHSLLSFCTEEDEDGKVVRKYGIAPAGKYYVKAEDGDSVAALTIFTHHRAIVDAMLRMEDVILGGGHLFQKLHNMSIFQYMKNDSSLNKSFNEAMADLSLIQTKKVLEVYDGFKGLSVLVDVGGGKGSMLRSIISKYPFIKGINFDLPQVIQHAPPSPGIQHVGGNMFESLPKGDAILIKGTCHNWSDESCLKLLKNCYKAIPDNGKVIIIDFIMPEEPEPTMEAKYVSLLDNAMFIQPGGKERTERQFEVLRLGSGFSEFKVSTRAIKALGVMEFTK